MAANLLADEMVRITTEGMERADQQTDQLAGKFDKMSQNAKKAEGFVKQLSKALQSMAMGPGKMFAGIESGLKSLQTKVAAIVGPLKALSIGGALGIGGIAAGAMAGTVQADRLGKAFEMLSRVLGDRLAPYVDSLSAGIMGLASWFNNLSDATKDTATEWALYAAGIGAVAALLPVIIGGVAAIAGAFAALTSPIMLTIGAIAAVAAAAVKLFNLFQDGGADAANSLNDSNRGWLESLTRGVQSAVNAMARMFNFIMEKAAKVSDWIAGVLASAGEMVGILPEGTRAELNKMEPIKPFQIDLGKVDGFFDHIAKRARQADEDFSMLGAGIGEIGNRMKSAFDESKKRGGMQIKMKVGFESADQTWQRLQTAFNERAGAQISIDQQQLDVSKQIAGSVAQGISAVMSIKDLLPVVR